LILKTKNRYNARQKEEKQILEIPKEVHVGSQKISFFAIFFLMGSALLLILPGPALTQDYPTKPITVYCGYEAGATTDLSARGLAAGLEKLLGVPVVVETKAGGGATVAAGLVASKKPDGYTLGVVSTGVITVRPHIFKVSYNPFKDFTLVAQYSRFIGGLCVLSESPLKTIDDFIAYAKAKPGLTYGSPGTYTQTHMAVELFSQCKGLNLKHVPYKGGAPANTALLGKHTDFVAGSGQHMQYLKQGVFRMLMIYNAEKRDPDYPNLPILKELGCPDAPALGYILVAPKELPEPVYQKLLTAVKKVTGGEEFQKLLKHLDLPYDFKDGKAMEKSVAAEYAWYKEFLPKMGAKVIK
jgi:tripartite-type tricarboxylate transporter receptor subunit TctC